MTVIKRGTIKSYDAAAHKATVQIAGSLGVWLDAVRVATDIPAADVVAGRQCSVLFLDPSNPDEAVVITIQGALPSGGQGVTDHGALTGLGDDDHTQYALLAGRAGGQTLQGGSDASEVLTLESTADATKAYVRVLDNIVQKDQPAVLQNALIGSKKNPPANGWVGFLLTVGSLSTGPSSAQMVGVRGIAAASNSDDAHVSYVYGLSFETIGGRYTGSPTYTEIVGTRSLWGCAIASGTTISDGACFKGGRYTSLFATVTRNSGVWIPDISKSIDANVYGVRVDDQAYGTNKYLAWFGPSTPRLRLDAGTPGANQTMLYLAEGTAPTLRRVQWKDGASIGQGDKVMVLV